MEIRRLSAYATDAQHLVLGIALSGNLKPILLDNTQELGFQDQKGKTVLRYDALYVYDANGQTLPSQFALAGDELRIHEDGARFGSSVALSGNTLVVGSPLVDCVNDNRGVDDCGEAHIHQRTFETWE